MDKHVDKIINKIMNAKNISITKKYKKLCLKCMRNNNDTEYGHILQDAIYRQFITDCYNNTFENTRNMRKVTKYMYKYIVKNDANWWYA